MKILKHGRKRETLLIGFIVFVVFTDLEKKGFYGSGNTVDEDVKMSKISFYYPETIGDIMSKGFENSFR